MAYRPVQSAPLEVDATPSRPGVGINVSMPARPDQEYEDSCATVNFTVGKILHSWITCLHAYEAGLKVCVCAVSASYVPETVASSDQNSQAAPFISDVYACV